MRYDKVMAENTANTPSTVNKTAVEVSSKDLADKVVTKKRRYFFPETGKSVEITPVDDENKNLEKAQAAADKESE